MNSPRARAGRLRMSSLQAENAMDFYRAVSEYLGRRLGLEVEFSAEEPWQERERRLDEGELEAAFLCGWPYVRKADGGAPLEVVAAPVHRGSRYRGRPVYFSEVLVRRDSPAQSFEDLRGAVWAYNERGSHSGYNLTLYHLASLGETDGYFGAAVEAGAHEASIEMLLSGEVDASAIDSYVFDVELGARPELAEELRAVERLGPSPSPPLVASSELERETIEAMRAVLVGMDRDPEGRSVLEAGRTERFAPVTDADYDEVRRMARLARAARLARE